MNIKTVYQLLSACACVSTQGEEARLRKQLEEERAALERERAAFAAELAKMQQGGQAQPKPQPQAQPQQPQQQQQKRGGWPFNFTPA